MNKRISRTRRIKVDSFHSISIDKPITKKRSFSYWVNSSALAFEYFHTRLQYKLIETSSDGDETCTMCFAPEDDSNLLFYVHYNQAEENRNLLENDSNYLETPKQFLKLVPVICEEAGGCLHMTYGQYE